MLALAVSDAPALLHSMQRLRDEVYEEGQAAFNAWRPLIERRDFVVSALNLAYFLALRRRDTRTLDAALMPLGLAALEQGRAYVLPHLDAALHALGAVCATPAYDLPPKPPLRAFWRGERLLRHHTDAVFGRYAHQPRARIMVTLPAAAADDYALVRALLDSGMDCARIDCAQDDSGVWQAMIALVRRAAEESGRPCKIAMELAGPQALTGAVLCPATLFKGDHLLLTGAELLPAEEYPRQAVCTLTEALDQVNVGESVWFNDGRIGGEVEAVLPEGLLLRIATARDQGETLASGQNIHFPETHLRLKALTEADLQDLDFVALYADIIHCNFVQEAADIDLLQRELGSRMSTLRPKDMALIVKIATQQAVRNLPEILVHGAGKQPLAVLLALGDLAVAAGCERLIETQEDILWLCEAAHVPVLWTTRTLDTLALTGCPARAAMSDFAVLEAAAGVALKRGPHLLEVLSHLQEMLTRMQAHHLKKRLRAPRV
ncbi:MAG: hypothetical protein HXY40_12735 [Chloroflexi bacterium]|nr:hypothetical protein [Chloroflexota bacterium]